MTGRALGDPALLSVTGGERARSLPGSQLAPAGLCELVMRPSSISAAFGDVRSGVLLRQARAPLSAPRPELTGGIGGDRDARSG